MMPLDHSPGEGGGDGDDTHIMCLFMGGSADGLCVPIREDADVIEIGRPTHVKPLESSHQAEPEIMKDSSIYHVAKMMLPWNDAYVQVGVGIVEGETPGWAIRELFHAYQRQAMEKLKEENQ